MSVFFYRKMSYSRSSNHRDHLTLKIIVGFFDRCIASLSFVNLGFLFRIPAIIKV